MLGLMVVMVVVGLICNAEVVLPFFSGNLALETDPRVLTYFPIPTSTLRKSLKNESDEARTIPTADRPTDQPMPFK